MHIFIQWTGEKNMMIDFKYEKYIYTYINIDVNLNRYNVPSYLIYKGGVAFFLKDTAGLSLWLALVQTPICRSPEHSPTNHIT